MQTSNSNHQVRLSFVGDICLSGGLQNTLITYGSSHPFKKIGNKLQKSDLVIGNLECCITEGEYDPNTPHNVMIVPENLAQGLLDINLNVVSLANNHIMDAGTAGLISTQKFLERCGIDYFGAGLNIDFAEKPLIISRKSTRFAFLGACDVPWVYASDNKAGAFPMLAKRMLKQIEEGKKLADVIIFSIHADLEFSPYPSPSRVKLSRWLVDNGADLVIQHHPHVCQGVEHYHNGLIAYSLGNFVFFVRGNTYFEEKSGTDWGIILHIDFDPASTTNRFAHSIVPVSINQDNATVASEGNALDEQMSFLSFISRQLENPREIRRQRLMRCLKQVKSTFYTHYYLLRREGVVAMLTSGFKILLSPYERRWMLSLITLGVF